MTERVVAVSLLAKVNNYVAGMEQARVATNKTAAAANDAKAKFEAQNAAMEQVGRGLVSIGAIAAVGIGIAVAKFVDFDRAISNVKAVTQESAENMGLLRDAALEAGGRTIYTATEAANAVEELGKASISTSDILSGALNGSLDLAASGQLEVARAAEITATTLQQFGLRGSDAAHVADVLSAGAGKALGSVEDLANGLKFVGPVAASMGVSLEDTTAVLALFAQQGIVGEQAGTGLRGMLSSLTSPSALARKEIERLGITLYDANGKFLGLENAAGELAGAYKGATDEQRDLSLGILFGNEQITAARVLYKAGAQGVADWRDKVNDAGYAARVAADRLDNLSGDVEKLGGSFDTYLIKSGSGANDILRSLVQSATSTVDAIGALPTPVLGVALGVGALTTAVVLGSGAFLLGVPKVFAYRTALEQLGPVAQRTGRVLEGVGKAAGTIAVVAVAIEALSLLAHSMDAASASTEQLQNALQVAPDAVKTFETALKGLDAFSLATASKDYGKFIDQVSAAPDMRWLPGFLHDIFALDPAADSARDKLGALGTQIATLSPEAASISFKQLVDEMGGGEDAALRLLNLLPDYKAALTTQATAAGMAADDQTLLKLALAGTAPETTKVSDGLEGVSGAAQGAGDQIDKLSDQIRGFADATLNTRDAQRQFQEAIDTAAETLQAQSDAYVEANGTLDGFVASLDIGTEAGRANEAALDAIAQASKEAAASIIDQTGSQEDASAAIQAGRDALILQLAQYGITGQAAEDYANNLGLIPGNITTAVGVVGADAAVAEVDRVKYALGTLRGVAVSVRLAEGRADGGPIFGVGGPKEDNIPIMASVGEHMLNARDVQRMGGHAGVYAFRRSLYQGLADGGPVLSRPSFVDSRGGGGNTYITVPVTVSAGIIADERQVGKLVTQAVKTAVSNGDVSKNWNN